MNAHRQIAEWISQASRPIAFTGAGISTESGIPDFRSPGGVWSQTQPVLFDDFVRSPDARYEYWRQKAIAHGDFHGSRPNSGHRTLARWQKERNFSAVITQNIDGLHQDAGATQVIELHGTARFVSCLDCAARFPADPLVRQFLAEDAVPECPECRGKLKHATISFGQSLDETVLRTAFQLAEQCDFFMVLGSSLVVEPAASLPVLAAQNGARLVIINRDDTDKDRLADLTVHAGIGDTLQAIDLELTEM